MPLRSRTRLIIAAAASVLALVAAPSLTLAGLYTSHVSSYHGVCGPHAPDIPEHPCSFEQYEAELFGGFSGIALIMLMGVAFIAAAVLVGTGWLVWITLRSRRRLPAT